jgi:hypothetical protein
MPKQRSIKAQVKSGFRSTGIIFLFMGWLGLVFGGLAVAFTPSLHSPVLGWFLLLAATVIFFRTMDRWIKGAFSGILAVATLNSFFCIITGHVTTTSAPISHLHALIMTCLSAGSTALSLTFRNRKLRMLDRVAIFIFVFCIFAGAVYDEVRLHHRGTDVEQIILTSLSLGIGLFCLFIAWAYDRFQRLQDNHQEVTLTI